MKIWEQGTTHEKFDLILHKNMLNDDFSKLDFLGAIVSFRTCFTHEQTTFQRFQQKTNHKTALWTTIHKIRQTWNGFETILHRINYYYLHHINKQRHINHIAIEWQNVTTKLRSETIWAPIIFTTTLNENVEVYQGPFSKNEVMNCVWIMLNTTILNCK